MVTTAGRPAADVGSGEAEGETEGETEGDGETEGEAVGDGVPSGKNCAVCAQPRDLS